MGDHVSQKSRSAKKSKVSNPVVAPNRSKKRSGSRLNTDDTFDLDVLLGPVEKKRKKDEDEEYEDDNNENSDDNIISGTMYYYSDFVSYSSVSTPIKPKNKLSECSEACLVSLELLDKMKPDNNRSYKYLRESFVVYSHL